MRYGLKKTFLALALTGVLLVANGAASRYLATPANDDVTAADSANAGKAGADKKHSDDRPANAEKVLELTKSIVAEKKITCLMVTHNMHQALGLGNRTLMMDSGRIVFDVKGEERSRMTVDDLLEKFRENAGKNLDNDRILLSKVEK